MMKLSTLLSIALSALLFVSCGLGYSYVANYSVGLKSVESPADAKKQFGETKVVNFQDGNTNKYRYEDDYIDIVWVVGDKKFLFELTNKSGHTLKINWDDISYVNCSNSTGRVMHSGVKYSERNNSQPASMVPKGASLTDVLIPTDNVYYSNFYKDWDQKYLIPCVYKSKADRLAGAPAYIGKTMTILMPIMIENVQNDYTFTFSIDKLLEDKN